MPRRKWRFEALEDRRLLAAVVSSPMPAALVNTTETAPVSAAGTAPVASTSTADQSGSQSDGSTSDNYAEYGSATPNASSDAASYSSNYGASAYGTDPSNEYIATDPSKSPSTSHSPAQPTATSSLQPVVNDPNTTLIKLASVDVPTLNNSASSPVPSAAVSPPVVRSSADLVGFDKPSAGAPADALTVNAATEAELLAPVALASLPVDSDVISTMPTAEDDLQAGAERIAPPADFGVGQPITGYSAVNFAAIEKGVDEVFNRLERLGNELEGVGATRFAEWLVIAGGACAAFEYARARYREGGPWQAAAARLIPYEPRLRRRWLRFRSLR